MHNNFGLEVDGGEGSLAISGLPGRWSTIDLRGGVRTGPSSNRADSAALRECFRFRIRGTEAAILGRTGASSRSAAPRHSL